MRSQLIVVILILLAVTPMLSAQDTSGGNDVKVATDQSQAVAGEEAALADVMAVPEALRRGPKDMLEDYETEMGAITQRFSATLLAIADALQRGELTSEQGQKISTEQYQTSQMQFELLAARRTMLEHDLASVAEPASNTNPAPTKDNQIVMVPCHSHHSNSILQWLNT